MKTNTWKFFVLIGFILTGCIKEGPMGPEGIPGRDGNANVYYSNWIEPAKWNGKTGDWYFEVLDNSINRDIVEYGVILAYMSVPGDIYQNAVRPMPAYAKGANWDFLIPDYGSIEFTCDALDVPATKDHLFRFVLIPSNIQLKSGSLNSTFIKELKAMTYEQACSKLGIPKD